MKNIRSALLVIFLCNISAHAADKIRIAIPEPNTAYLMFPLEAKRAAKVNRDVSMKDVADLSILREAQKEMGSNNKKGKVRESD